MKPRTNKLKTIITGGSGFIGTHLIKKLLNTGDFDITVIDLVYPKIPGVGFIESNISDVNKFKSDIKDADVVIHLAAVMGVDHCNDNPEKVWKTNYCDTKNFIDICIENKVKKFIFSSSSEVYGNSKDIPYQENNVLDPISLYAKNKIKIEEYLSKNSSKFNVGIVRFFNVYGPWQKNNFVIPAFIEAALENRDINIFGDGNQSRCFTYVEDAVDGLEKFMRYNKTPFEIINIGHSTETRIKDLAKIVLEYIPETKSKIVFKQYGGSVREPHFDIARRIPLVKKAYELLKFKANTDLRTGIVPTINHFRNIKQTKATDLLLPPINQGKISEIYPWNGKILDIVDCIFYPFTKILPSKGDKYESTACDFFGTKNIRLVDSGKSALFLALQTIGVGKGDEVVLLAFNCPSVIEPIFSTGATPHFVDMTETGGIDLESFKNIVSKKTKCVVVTNTYGLLDDLKKISIICRTNNIFFINDLSQVLEDPTDNEKFNKYGDISIYSFGQEKHIFALGGGAIVSNNEELFKIIKHKLPTESVSFYSNVMTVLQRVKYYFSFFIYRNTSMISGIISSVGMAYSFTYEKELKISNNIIKVRLMNDLQKKILKRKLRLFNTMFKSNIENFNLLKNSINYPLMSNKIKIPLYATMLLEAKERFMVSDYLSKNGVLSVWNYLPLYKAVNISTEECFLPNTEKIWRAVLSIPFRFPIKKKRIIEICKIINSYEGR